MQSVNSGSRFHNFFLHFSVLSCSILLSPPGNMTSMSITFVGSVPSITGTRRDWPRGGEAPFRKSPGTGRRGPGVYPALWAAGLVAVTQRRAVKRGKPMPPEQAENQPPRKTMKFMEEL